MKTIQLLLLTLLLWAGVAPAQDTFSTGWSTITGGGALRSGAGEFTMSGAIGQFSAGTNPVGPPGEFSMTGGFWTLPPGAGGNADLTAIILSDGALSPSFLPAVTAYTTTVSTYTASLAVSPFASGESATIQVRVNGGGYASVSSGGTTAPLPLNTGSNLIEILVTASGGTTTKLYTLTATRTPPGASGEVDAFNANVSGLTVNATVVDPQERILIGGSFTSVQGTPRGYIARLQADGTLDAGFNPQATGDVVSVAVQPDGKVLLGGSFTNVGGQSRSRIARVNDDGTLDTTFNPSPNNFVLCVVPDGSGKILIGGGFTTVQGQSRAYLARLNANGTLDSAFAPVIGGVVNCVAVQPDGKIIVGGAFTTAGGQTRNRLARLNANGTLDTGFDPNADNQIGSLTVLPDGKILIGGFFSTMGGQSRPYLARVLASGALDNSFQPAPSNFVTAAAVQSDGKILVSGAFTLMGGQTRNRVARFNTNGTLDTFAPDANGNVFSIALQGNGQVLLGGEFFTVNGTIRNRFARIHNDSAVRQLTVPTEGRILWTRGGSAPDLTQVTFESYDGGIWEPLGEGTRIAATSNWEITGLFLPGTGTIRARGRTSAGYLSGGGGLVEQVSSYAMSNNANLSALSINAGVLSPAFAPGTTIYSTSVSNSTTSLTVAVTRAETSSFVLMRVNGGGWYVVAPGTAFPLPLVPGDNTFEILVTAPDDVTTKLYTLFAERRVSALPCEVYGPDMPVTGTSVTAIATDASDRILLAGNFTSVAGGARFDLARLHPNCTLDTTFDPQVNDQVFTLAVQPDGKILLGGIFVSVGGQPRSRIARVNEDGTLDAGFNADANGNVIAIALEANGSILLTGDFTTVQGQPRSRIARVFSDGTLDPAFSPIVNDQIHSLAVQQDGKILVGGNFITVNGQTRVRIARLHANGTLDTGFNPTLDNGPATLTPLADGKIIVGGFFTSVSGQPRNHLARLNADGTLDPAFNPNPNNYVISAALQSDGKLIFSGFFTTVGGQTRNRIARLNINGTLDAGFNPDANGTVNALAIEGNGRVLAGGTFTSMGGGAQTNFARLANETATRQLNVVDATTISWLRAGSAPALSQVTFDHYDDYSSNWVSIGTGTRVGESYQWQITGLNLIGSGTIRARGRTGGGYVNGSSGIVEQQQSYSFPTGYAWWASNNIPSGYDATFSGDWNGDSISNGISYTFGTAIPNFAGTGGIVAPSSVPADADLYLERSTTLAASDWTPIASWLKGDAPTFASGVSMPAGTVSDTFSGPRAYYRYRAVPGYLSYANDFAAAPAATLRGSAMWVNQSLRLTDALPGQLGAAVLDGVGVADGQAGFDAYFSVAIGPTTTGVPADGLSFTVGDPGTGPWGENGPGTAHSLTLVLDTYDNLVGQSQAIGIRLNVNGVMVAYHPANPYTGGAAVPVEVHYTAATGVTVLYNGAPIFTNVAVPAFTLQAGDQYGFGGRTGGANEVNIVDDVSILAR